MTRLARLLRDHGDELETDLAAAGYDLRDHYRPRSGPSRLTSRRLRLIIRAIPLHATLNALRIEQMERDGKSTKPRLSERIEDRAAYYARLAAEQETNA